MAEAVNTDTAAKPSQDFFTKANDLNALRDSVVNAASVSGALWITYLGVLFYLLIAIGSVTHKDLFLENAIRLPFISVDLPMDGFFLLGPVVFVSMHAYVLLHFVMMAGKIADLDEALVRQITDPDVQTKLRRQLPANIFVQFLAGPSEVRDGITGLFLWLIALFTLVIGPILLLLYFELQFLPHHSELITWVQRLAVWIDLALLWLFWPRIALRRSTAMHQVTLRSHMARMIKRVGTTGTLLSLTFICVPLLLLIATFPGEALDRLSPSVPGSTLLIDETIDLKTLRPQSPFSRLLLLPKFDAVDQAKLDSKQKLDYATQSVAVYGRDLHGAVLKVANLAKVNFIFSDLTGSDMGAAILTDARLDWATLTSAKLEWTDLTNANLNHARLDHTDLSHAKLGHARLDNANLSYANLTGANLEGASLASTRLDHATMTEATITQSQLDTACGEQASLPPGLTVKPCKPVD